VISTLRSQDVRDRLIIGPSYKPLTEISFVHRMDEIDGVPGRPKYAPGAGLLFDRVVYGFVSNSRCCSHCEMLV